jgi:hypothetical protein
MTVRRAEALGFCIRSHRVIGTSRRVWYLRTPWAGWLPCPSLDTAWRTLLGVVPA